MSREGERVPRLSRPLNAKKGCEGSAGSQGRALADFEELGQLSGPIILLFLFFDQV